MKIPTDQQGPFGRSADPQTVDPRSAPIGDDAHTYLTARQTRARYGDVSDMSIWRWLRDPKLNFPKPIRINGRRFWRLADLVAWEKQREAA